MSLAFDDRKQPGDLRLISADSGGSADEGLPLYVRAIGQIPLLTPEDEIELASTIEAGRAAAEALESPRLARTESVGRLREDLARGNDARSRLIEGNLRLVVSIARRYVNRGLPMDDLIQAGNLGLLRAAEKFDHRLGFRFSTYATWWVHQAVMRAVADQARPVRVPEHLLGAAQRLNRYAVRIEVEEGREPTTEELAPKVGLRADRLRAVQRALATPASLDLGMGDDHESVLGDFVPDPDEEPLEQIADRDVLAVEMRELMASLTARERYVLALRYGFDDEPERTLEEIGHELGVTRERVRQIEAAALRKLRRPDLARRLKAFV